MRKVLYTVLFAFFLINGLFSAENLNVEKKPAKDIHYFIRKAWVHDSKIKQAQFDIKKYRNLKLEAISVYTPKINGMTWIAPIYSREGDYRATNMNTQKWGPYFHLDLMFQQPVFAFTRVISGIKAAQAGENVARADVEMVKWQVAKDVRLYYYGIIFGKTLMKTINMADDMLSNAIKAAEEAMEEGDDSITEADLSKLKFFYGQVPINRSFATKAIEQAQQALELSTGERLADEDIPPTLELELASLESKEFYRDLMFQYRPLMKKLNSGIDATRHLMELEYKSMIPVLFVGGYIKYNRTPTFPTPTSILQREDFNTLNNMPNVGAAFGLFWQFDPLKSVARGLQKKAELDKLNELKEYANDGFPIQIGKVVDDLKDLKHKAEVHKEAISNAQSWMFFAANSYAIGSGEAKDIMEGLAAYVQAKQAYYQAIYDYNMMLGDLCAMSGIDVTVLKDDE